MTASSPADHGPDSPWESCVVPLVVFLAAGMLEPFGVPFTATINAVAYSLWAVWALMLGTVVLRSERSTGSGMPITV